MDQTVPAWLLKLLEAVEAGYYVPEHREDGPPRVVAMAGEAL